MRSAKMLVTAVLLLDLVVWPREPTKATPVGTAFTYQGWLTESKAPADGLYDFRFRLFDDPNIVEANQVGPTIVIADFDVVEGYFAPALDFYTDANDPNIFTGQARWLEIAVRPSKLDDPKDYVVLLPRQEVMPTPYALYALSGNPGPQGLKGDKGDTGATGPQGPPGDSHWQIWASNTYYNAGKVGIGTSTPVSKLSVGGNGIGNAGVYGWGTSFGVYGSSNSVGVYGEDSGSGSSGRLGYGDWGGYFSGDGYFSGNVGIGTTNPLSKLSVGGNGIANIGVYSKGSSAGVWGEDSDNGSSGRLGFATYGVYGSGSSAGVHGVNSDSGSYGRLGYGDWGGYFSGDGYFSGNVGIGTTNPLSELSVGGDGDADAGVYGKGTKYGVYGQGPYRGVYGRGTLYGVYGLGDETGVYGYGDFGVLGAGDTGVRGAGADYDFYAAGPGINYGAASSIRWKSNIQNIDDPLGKLVNLRGVYFNWDEEHGGQHDVGMIAEEVGEVLPEIVEYEENGVDATGMDYSKLTPLLVEAIKELKAENDALRQRLETLETRFRQDQPATLEEVRLAIN